MNRPSQNLTARDLVAEFSAAIVVGICLFSNLGAIGLVGPDEPRYAWIARAMAETGDWVTPRLYGVPWFEKPVLYYWAAAVGFKLQLSAEWSARLPSAFAALGAAIAIGWIAVRYFADRVSGGAEPLAEKSRLPLLVAVVFASSVAGIGFARAATPDMLFSAAITLAMALSARVLTLNQSLASSEQNREPSECGTRDRERDTAALILFGVALGFGVLAKGPAAVILAGGAIAIWAVLAGKIRAAFRLAHPIAIAAFCVVALPWYTVCQLRNPDFLHVFIFQHNFERYLTPVFQHIQPFWFFIPVSLVALIPWTAFLVAAFSEGVRWWKSGAIRNSPALFFVCWAIFPILFFSFSKSKLPSYILPGLPALVLLATVAAARLFRRSHLGSVFVAGCMAITWVALAGVAGAQIRKLPGYITASYDLNYARSCVVAAVIVLSLLLLFAATKRKFAWLVAINSAAVAVTLVVASAKILPAVDPFVSARVHGVYAAQNPGTRFFTYKLRRSWNYGLAFYAHGELPEWSPAERESGTVLTNAAGYADIKDAKQFPGDWKGLDQAILSVPVPGADER